MRAWSITPWTRVSSLSAGQRSCLQPWERTSQTSGWGAWWPWIAQSNSLGAYQLMHIHSQGPSRNWSHQDEAALLADINDMLSCDSMVCYLDVNVMREYCHNIIIKVISSSDLIYRTRQYDHPYQEVTYLSLTFSLCRAKTLATPEAGRLHLWFTVAVRLKGGSHFQRLTSKPVGSNPLTVYTATGEAL